MKRFLTVIAIVFSIVLGSYVAADAVPRIKRPIGTVVSPNPGGHAWDAIKVIGETRTGGFAKSWLTIEYYRTTGTCREKVFALYQVESIFGIPVSRTLVKETVLETTC